jgi:hypothetical protein
MSIQRATQLSLDWSAGGILELRLVIWSEVDVIRVGCLGGDDPGVPPWRARGWRLTPRVGYVTWQPMRR